MNNSILIAIILSVGIVAAVIVNKAIDYYFLTQVIESTKIITNSDNLTKSMIDNHSKKTMKVWVPGRSMEYCMKGQEAINNNVQRCTNGYYIEKLIR